MANFSKSNVPQFSVDVYQNEYLPEGGREVNAIVTVTSTGGGTVGTAVAAPHLYTPGQGPAAAVVIMVDCSGSMDYPPTKMRNARDATAAAIDTLRDGVAFAVVAGTHVAKEVYPGNGRLAVADADHPRAGQAGAAQAERGRRHRDRHLAAARRPAAVHGGRADPARHPAHRRPQRARVAARTCGPRSTPAPDGSPVTRAASAPTGRSRRSPGSPPRCSAPPTSSPIRRASAADFTQMMETAMGKEVADVALRLWTPVGAEIRFVKQVAPTVEELTGPAHRGGPARRATTRPAPGVTSPATTTCAWRSRRRTSARRCWPPASRWCSRSRTAPSATGLSQGLVRAVWTDDMVASTSINPQVAHYTGQAELAQVIQQGLDAAQSRAISMARRRNWAGRCSSRAPPGTRILRNCLRRWWTWSTRRQVLCD